MKKRSHPARRCAFRDTQGYFTMEMYHLNGGPTTAPARHARTAHEVFGLEFTAAEVLDVMAWSGGRAELFDIVARMGGRVWPYSRYGHSLIALKKRFPGLAVSLAARDKLALAAEVAEVEGDWLGGFTLRARRRWAYDVLQETNYGRERSHVRPFGMWVPLYLNEPRWLPEDCKSEAVHAAVKAALKGARQ
jgi:hypothetical protein